MQTVAEALGVYASTLKYADLPADVVHQVKRTIVDTLGCAFAGYESEPARVACDLAGLVESAEPATIFCSGRKTSVELAAFANDVMVRHFNLNDAYFSKGTGHPSDSIPALIAAAEVARASGRELIVATALAYEFYCRLSDAWNNKASGIDHVTIGAIASVAGVARLFNLTQPQIVEAINLTVVSNITLAQTRIGNVSQWKTFAYAYANRNAIFAAQLAARGMTGPSPIFEGRNGFFKIVSRESFALSAFGGNGQPFRIMNCDLRQFPLGNLAQTVVTAALEARSRIGRVQDIAAVNIRVSQKAIDVMADEQEKWRPRNHETADHSMPYNAAVALMFGTVDQKYFEEEYFGRNRELLALVDRVKCTAFEEANRRATEINLCELEITMRSGERHAVRTEFHRGHHLNPMTDAEIETKFRTLAAGVLRAGPLDALLAQLWKLEDLTEVGMLVRMTQAGD